MRAKRPIAEDDDEEAEVTDVDSNKRLCPITPVSKRKPCPWDKLCPYTGKAYDDFGRKHFADPEMCCPNGRHMNDEDCWRSNETCNCRRHQACFRMCKNRIDKETGMPCLHKELFEGCIEYVDGGAECPSCGHMISLDGC